MTYVAIDNGIVFFLGSGIVKDWFQLEMDGMCY